MPPVSESIETQFEICRQYAAKQGWTIASEHFDADASGADEDRLGLWTALAMLREGEVLLVYRLDRIARSIYFALAVEQEVAKAKGRLVSACGEGTWDEGPEAEMVRRILQALAEYQRKIGAARTRASMLAMQANGRRVGGKPPIGFVADPDGGTNRRGGLARLKKADIEQAAVQRAVALAEQGFGPHQIAKTLTKENRPTRSGKPWHHATIARMLKRAQGKRSLGH